MMNPVIGLGQMCPSRATPPSAPALSSPTSASCRRSGIRGRVPVPASRSDAVMSIVLHGVGDHVHDAPRHALYTGVTRLHSPLEQARANIRGFSKRASRLQWRRAQTIERSRARPGTTRSGEHPPDALHVGNDSRDRATSAAGRFRPPQRRRQSADEVLIDSAVVSERLEQLTFNLQWSSARHVNLP